MSDRILFVDDEPAVFDGIRRLLHKKFDMDFAQSGQEALAKLKSAGPYAVICTDMRMPGMDGIALLAEVAKHYPDVVRVMLTGNADQSTAVSAINDGKIFSFLNKPVSRETLATTLENALRLASLLRSEKELLERTLAGAVRTLLEILAAAYPEIFSKSARVRSLAREIGNLVEANPWKLDMASMLAPIGWATIPPLILEKIRWQQALLAKEQELVERVPEGSAHLIGNIPRLEPIAEIVRYQAKNFDGSGLPSDDRLGEDIPLEARILHLASAIVDSSSTDGSMESRLDRLFTHERLYDPELLAVAQGYFRHLDATHSTKLDLPPGAPIKLTACGLLKPGDKLAEDLMFEDGDLALAHETVMTELLIQRLINMSSVRILKQPILVHRPAEPAP